MKSGPERDAREALRLLERRLTEVMDEAVTELDRRLRRRAIDAVIAHALPDLSAEVSWSTNKLTGTLSRIAGAAVVAIERLEGEGTKLLLTHQSAASDEARREIIVQYIRRHGTSGRAVAKDIAATARWFDLEAVQERIAAEIADRVDEIDVAYQTMAHAVEKASDTAKEVAPTEVLRTAIAHAQPGGRVPVRTAALRFLVRCVARMPLAGRLSAVGITFARQVQAWGRGESTTRWAQVAALHLCGLLFPQDAFSLIADRLRDREGRDGMVIRANALRVLERMAAREQLPTALIALDDPSEHVRQELARLLRRLGSREALGALVRLTTTDPSPRVAGIGLRELVGAACSVRSIRADVTTVIELALADVARPLFVRVALEAVRVVATGFPPPMPPRAFVPALEGLANRADAAAELSESAAAVLRWLEVDSDSSLRSLRDTFATAFAPLREGQSTRVSVPPSATPSQIERALAVASRGDMTMSLRRIGAHRFVLTRGEPRGWRLWRAINESRTPMPDKRKGYLHTNARVPTGEIVVPPIGMAEVTPTRVPGERQLSGGVGGWGPFLPRVDDLLATATLRARTLRIVTASGTVSLRGPASLSGRLKARARLSLRYVQFATARERSLVASEAGEKRAYAKMAADLGFSIELGDCEGSADGAAFSIKATRPALYEAALSLPFIAPGWVDAMVSYVVSPGGSTPSHLGLIAWVIFAGVIARGAWIMREIERARRGVPLTIGGWGTRGKSGSERLKAALFHALRYDVVVKTTGCEAMFIHALRDMAAQEIFIYRPYDKATIWEQRNVLHVACQLGAQVFLWECMALQPRFVETLANEWMHDDVTTLTNAYPDHEDIQGPGGEDVARVIARFMPNNGKTFTTEDQMLPLIADSARRKNTELAVVPPIEADLLPLDLLDRLPYQEHPRNVAMVLALADHYEVDREFAIVEIADYVIADLGVLKTYPTVQYRGRALTFSNGMSANERAGFMSNWTRLGFDKNDVDSQPEISVMAIVNNRGDRVARSRVFAQIFVDDAPVDHIVLINSNLAGLMQFITEALDGKLAELRITGEGGTPRALERFDDFMKWLKVPTADDSIPGRVRRMLLALPMEPTEADRILALPEVASAMTELGEGLGAALESALAKGEPPASPAAREDRRADVIRHAVRLISRVRTRKTARAEVSVALERSDDAQANAVFRKAYRTLFLDRIVVLWDTNATGDQVIDFSANEIAPGQQTRIMGTQNIKGTGLDFVYRWLSIDRVRANLQRLRAEPHTRTELLAWLGSYTDFGLIDCREALDTVKDLRASGAEDWAPQHSLLDSVIERLGKLEAEKSRRLVSSGKASLTVRVLSRVEAFVDHLDSVRRTRLAAKVMGDLFTRRVGHGQAALLLREVTGRQKGGWLAKDLAKWRATRKKG